jgi:hypothetical protein
LCSARIYIAGETKASGDGICSQNYLKDPALQFGGFLISGIFRLRKSGSLKRRSVIEQNKRIAQ